MVDVYVFYIIAAITIISSISVFLQRRLVHSVISLAVAFLGSALLFFLIGQTLAALLQLIVFVGGFSTYLIVAVATEEGNAKLLRMPVFAVLSIFLFAGVVLAFQSLPQQPVNSGSSLLTAASVSFSSDYAILYIIAVLLFSAAIGGVMIIKKFTKLLI